MTTRETHSLLINKSMRLWIQKLILNIYQRIILVIFSLLVMNTQEC